MDWNEIRKRIDYVESLEKQAEEKYDYDNHPMSYGELRRVGDYTRDCLEAILGQAAHEFNILKNKWPHD